MAVELDSFTTGGRRRARCRIRAFPEDRGFALTRHRNVRTEADESTAARRTLYSIQAACGVEVDALRPADEPVVFGSDDRAIEDVGLVAAAEAHGRDGRIHETLGIGRAEADGANLPDRRTCADREVAWITRIGDPACRTERLVAIRDVDLADLTFEADVDGLDALQRCGTVAVGLSACTSAGHRHAGEDDEHTYEQTTTECSC